MEEEENSTLSPYFQPFPFCGRPGKHRGHCAAQALGGDVCVAVHVKDAPGIVQPTALWKSYFPYRTYSTC